MSAVVVGSGIVNTFSGSSFGRGTYPGLTRTSRKKHDDINTKRMQYIVMRTADSPFVSPIALVGLKRRRTSQGYLSMRLYQKVYYLPKSVSPSKRGRTAELRNVDPCGESRCTDQ